MGQNVESNIEYSVYVRFLQCENIRMGSDEIPHRTAPDPQKLAERSPQPGKTMGSPGTLPLMGGHP